MMSNKFSASLKPDEQKVFLEVGRNITAQAYATSAKLEAKYFAEMKARVKINKIDLAAFQKATASTYDKYKSSQGGDYLKFVHDTAKP